MPRLVVLVALALIASLAVPSVTSAQPRDFTHAYQTWLGVDWQGPIHQDLFSFGDVQPRLYDDFAPTVILLRTGLLWRMMPTMFLGGGYAWTPSWRSPGTVGFADEHRLFEQWQYEWIDAAEGGTGIRIHFRTRFEQRFRHPTGTVEVGLRLRQRVRLMVPLTTDRALFFITWDELFVALTDSGGTPDGVDAMGDPRATPRWQYGGFDQNRFFLGLGYQIVPGVVRIEGGYINHWVRRPSNALGDAMNHAAFLNVSLGWS